MKTFATGIFLRPVVASIAMLAAFSAFAQEHRWAGRTLGDFEWSIHERLAALPSHGVFDTLRFEVHGNTVALSGQVMKESAKENAERAVARLDGVEKVVNHIELLPSSRRDDALRKNLYHAIYENQPLDKYARRARPSIHIVVKNGWVSLEGVVDSDSDRSLVHSRALQVTSHVSDNPRVAPEES